MDFETCQVQHGLNMYINFIDDSRRTVFTTNDKVILVHIKVASCVQYHTLGLQLRSTKF